MMNEVFTLLGVSGAGKVDSIISLGSDNMIDIDTLGKESLTNPGMERVPCNSGD